MPPRDYDDRRVEVYFGPSRKVDVTKEELADFIIEKMGLERSDEGPKWTEGVSELVKLGMKAFEEKYQDDPEFGEEVAKLNRKLDEYQSDIREMSTKRQKPFDSLIQASKLTRRTQARILEVLSDRAWEDDGNMMLVDLSEVSKEADLEYSAVSHHARLLDYQGFVERGEYYDKVKLSYRNAFEKFCDMKMVDPDSI